MFEGITVPVLDIELAELESSSSSISGSGGGREESFVLANDLARSDIVAVSDVIRRQLGLYAFKGLKTRLFGVREA